METERLAFFGVAAVMLAAVGGIAWHTRKDPVRLFGTVVIGLLACACMLACLASQMGLKLN